MFEACVRNKYRFPTNVGLVTVEDLYDMPLLATGNHICLNDIAKTLNKELKNTDEEDFVSKKTITNKTLELKLEIVKHIIAVKVNEIENKENATIIKQEVAKIDAIIARKEDSALEGKSLTELKKMKNKLIK